MVIRFSRFERDLVTEPVFFPIKAVMRKIYLDYNATCPILPAAIAAAADAMGCTGNASSIHGFGREARRMVEDARGAVAALCNVRPAQVIFNAGATEGNNTILSGYQDKIVFISAIEHPSVMEAAPHARLIPVTEDGVIDIAAFEAMVVQENPALVCVQLVNSETGVVQPVAEIARIAKEKGAMVQCDAVQGAGRIEIDFKQLGVDYLTLSAHKFGGAQGAGALIFREGLQMPKFMRGGGQEKRQRAGTENVPAIAAFGAAARAAVVGMADYQARCEELRARLEQGLKAKAADLIVTGEGVSRVANTVNIILPGASAETMVMAMDLEGIAVSSGSACSSGAFKPSHVLAAMGYGDAAARSVLRFSYGWATTEADIDDAIAAFGRMAARVKK